MEKGILPALFILFCLWGAHKLIERLDARGVFDRPTRVIIVADSSACEVLP